MYFVIYIWSTEKDVNICVGKTWTASDRLLIIWKSDLSDKIRKGILSTGSYVSTTVWLHHLDINKILRKNARLELHKYAVLKNPGSFTLKDKQLYSHLLSILKSIQVSQARHAEYCWWSKDEVIIGIPLWTPA